MFKKKKEQVTLDLNTVPLGSGSGDEEITKREILLLSGLDQKLR